MHRQLSRTVDIQTGVVLGNLDRAHRAATWIATREEREPLPTEGDIFQDKIRSLAGSIAETTDLNSVAAQVGEMAGACGSCHQATRSGPYFVVRSSPPQGTSQASSMVRHLWAADRMWEGVVGPSDDAWLAGARALGQAEPALARAIEAANSPAGAERTLDAVTRLARQAQAATTQADRAQVYGEILSTCHACHTAMKRMAKKTDEG